MAASTSAPASPITRAGLITLTEPEEKIVSLLDRFGRGRSPPIECRLAGGWVRDKILSLPSHDLDVALSTTSGYAFAVDFAEFLHTQGVPTGSVGRVAANPEQSKHLETGTTTIMGLGCDFVGLRSETYTDSRIPDQVTLGTPLEDALRRDLTVNSLFFNVHTREIEDWTRSGLSDLDARVARTPLPPRQTFLDDPLRVLRCVRFASRFGLRIEPDVEAAILEEDIKFALKEKVSKERIGIETTKMLEKTPLASLELMESLRLNSSIFMCSIEPPNPRSEALDAARILTEVLKRYDAGLNRDSEEDALNLWFAAAACPFRGAIITHKKREVPAVSVIMRDNLKLSNEINSGVTNLFTAATLLDPELIHASRSKIGITLQQPAVKPWEQSLAWSIVDRILPTWKGQWTAAHDAVFQSFMALRDRIVELGLPDAIKQPPLLDGKTLQRLLDIKPSPLLSVILRAINGWQLDHPGSTAEECTAWVLENWNGEGKAQWEALTPKPPNKTGKAAKRKS